MQITNQMDTTMYVCCYGNRVLWNQLIVCLCLVYLLSLIVCERCSLIGCLFCFLTHYCLDLLVLKNTFCRLSKHYCKSFSHLYVLWNLGLLCTIILQWHLYKHLLPMSKFFNSLFENGIIIFSDTTVDQNFGLQF